ncbi:MAG: SIS domain-containing protein [Phycisphaerales bacterium]|jgi:D-sedoheptulose 7-phosphate isomerase
MKKEISEALKIHKELLAQFEKVGIDIVTQAAEMLIETFKKDGRVYLCGNGGSAADCQHIAGELIGRFRREREALPAVALSTDTSVITCIANDYSYENIFARQVEGLITQSDILWAFSTSGTSPNVLAAAKLAKEKDARVLAFTGKADTPLERISDLCLCIDSPYTSSSQEIHQLAYHMICDLVEADMCED